MTDFVDTRDAETGCRQALQAPSLLVTEYRRAFAAEEYYVGLKRMNASALAREGIARCDISRCVFRKFYAFSGE